MGCWNATCALSGLPITYLTPVKFLLLVAGREQYDATSPPAAGLTYPGDLWMPALWPVDALYDDYGFIEQATTPAPGMFKRRMAQLAPSQASPFWTNFPVLGDDRSLYGGKVLHRSPFGGLSPLGHTFIRSDVWDALLAMTQESIWGAYTQEKMRDAAQQIAHRLITDFDAAFNGAEGEEDRHLAIAKWGMRAIIALEDSPSHLIRELKREFSWFTMLIVATLQDDRSPDKDRSPVYKACPEVADLALVHALMNPLRKAWMPGTCRGSQDAPWELHKAFSDVVGGIAEREKTAEEEDG